MTKQTNVDVGASKKPKMSDLDRIVLLCVMVLLAVLVASTLRSDTYFEGAYAVKYEAYYRSLMLLIICGYLFFKRGWLVYPDSVTRVVMGWVGWIGLSSQFWDADHNLRFYVLSTTPEVLLWPLIYLYFYEIGKLKNLVMTRRLVAFFCAIFFFSTYGFWQAFSLANQSFFPLLTGAALLNQIYYPLLLMPWILLLNKRKWHYLGITAILVMVFFSMKRTAFFAFGTAVLVYFWTFRRLKISARLKRTITLAAVLLVIVVLAIFPIVDEKMGFTFSERFKMSEIQRAGNRLEIYQTTIEMIWDSAALPALLGHGHLTVRQDSPLGYTAHSDWLEVIYDYGIGGIIIYMLLHVFLIKKCRRLIGEKSPYSTAFTVSYTLFLFMSLSSHLIIYPTYFVFLAAFWGMVGGLTAPARIAPRPSRMPFPDGRLTRFSFPQV